MSDAHEDRTEGSGGRPRRGRKVRVDFRKNISKKARDKGEWTRGYQEHQYHDEDHETGESVRAKGALSRRRTIIEDAPPADESAWRDGVVTAVRGAMVDVDADGVRVRCTVRRVLRSRLIDERVALAVGDCVRFAPIDARGAENARDEAEPEGVIEAVAPRRETLVRQYGDRVQVIAANVDQALILASVVDPPLRPHLLDRYLVAAHKGELRPVLCINKGDLVAELDDDSRAELEDIEARYRDIGYTVVRSSAVSGEGVDAVREVLKDRTTVVVGMSGVGKSSLLNAVQPGLALKIGDIDDLGRGRHTTTTAELLRLEFGGFVVDTPGIRQFELAHVDAVELEAYFPEFAERVRHCRFPNCRHLSEVDCAIRAAVEAGEIHPARYESYVRMLTQRLNEQT